MLTIEFMLEQNSDVLIEVMNALGQKTSETMIKNPGIGTHQMQLKVSELNMSSGLCYFKIIAGNKTSFIKCNYIKTN